MLLAGTSATKLKFSLLENAYDSMNSSLRHANLGTTSVRAWKLAMFLLVHSLELLMKERLHREHQLLVFSNVDKPRHTVSMEVALDRLQAIGVAIDPADETAIRTAIDWRDRIAHYELDVALADVQRVYALLFEFAHTLHHKELGSDLHSEIDRENWVKEAELIELFRSDFVVYNGVNVIKEWPAQLVSAQHEIDLKIEGKTFDRIPYGENPAWTDASAPCHDCAALMGQIHVFGCDMEECPRCSRQLITCECDVTLPGEMPTVPTVTRVKRQS